MVAFLIGMIAGAFALLIILSFLAIEADRRDKNGTKGRKK